MPKLVLVLLIDIPYRFERMPIGPVGRHVHLVGKAADDSNIADLLQAELSERTLRSFIVNSDRDYRELEVLIKQRCMRNRPRICIMPIIGRRFDIRSGMVHTNDDMPGVLDYLSFDNDDVFNYVCGK